MNRYTAGGCDLSNEAHLNLQFSCVFTGVLVEYIIIEEGREYLTLSITTALS